MYKRIPLEQSKGIFVSVENTKFKCYNCYEVSFMWKYCAESNSFIIEITGGSVRIIGKENRNLLKVFKGYNYLYTGGINPDETDFFALENGKHFYIYSLKDFDLVKRVTLPRTYESIDVCGFYSDDGKILNIPAQRYVYEDKEAHKGHYEYVLCKYACAILQSGISDSMKQTCELLC